MSTIRIVVPGQDPLNEPYSYRPTGDPYWDRHRDPITLNEIPEDDPDREFPTGFGEKRIREYDGLFELLDRIEDNRR